MIPNSQSARDLIENWYHAAERNLDTTGRMKLYEDTERLITSLYQSSEEDKLLFCRLAQQVFETKSPADSNKLSEWIANNTGIDNKGYSGAYSIFNELFKAAHLEENSDLEGLALKQIDSKSLDYMSSMSSIKEDEKPAQQKLGKDVRLHTLSYLSNKDLVSMSLSSSQNREEVITIFINRLNTGEITLDKMGFKKVSQAIEFFGERSLEIIRLDLRKFSIKDSDFEKILENFPEIQHLFLYQYAINNITVSFFEKMNHLTHLDLTRCRDDLAPRSRDSSFSASCPSMRSLTLRECDISKSGILEECPFLKSLNLSSCQIYDISLLKNLPSLTNLNILSSNQLTDVSFLQYCKDLRSLSFSGCKEIKDISFLQHCKELKSLDLSGCTQINDFSFLQHCTELESLDLSGFETIKDISFLQHCKKLKSLNLSMCRQINDISCLQHCKKLTNLDLSRCNQVKDISFLQHCKELTSLNLLWCTQINDISCLHDCKELKSLNIKGCQINNDSIKLFLNRGVKIS